MSARFAMLQDVLNWRTEVERPNMRHARAWGPILDAAAAADGCVRAAASVVIIPRIPAKVVPTPRQLAHA